MSKTYYTKNGEEVKAIRQDKKTNFINYVGLSSQWLPAIMAKRNANELTNISPQVQIFDKNGKYHKEATNRIRKINETSWYSENNNTNFGEVVWEMEHRTSQEGRISAFVHEHEEEFSGEKLPLITLPKNIILENRENNKSLYAYFILSRKKIQNAYLFTVAVSQLGKLIIFDYQDTATSIALTPDEIDQIVKKDKRTKAYGKVSDLVEIPLKNNKFVYHQINYNLPNGLADFDYVRDTQLTDMLDEISWAMLWEIQSNQTKVVLLTAVASGSAVQKKELAQTKLREWKSQIQINIETTNTTDQQSITVHNPQLQNTLPVYFKAYKDVMNMIFKLSGSAKESESNDKGTAQQTKSEFNSLGSSQYETIQIKKKLRQTQFATLFRRIIEYDKIELGNTKYYPDEYTVRVTYVTASESDKSQLLENFTKEQNLGIKSKKQMIIEYYRGLITEDEAKNILDDIEKEMPDEDKENPEAKPEEKPKEE